MFVVSREAAKDLANHRLGHLASSIEQDSRVVWGFIYSVVFMCIASGGGGRSPAARDIQVRDVFTQQH
jgi:hypothetical protein